MILSRLPRVISSSGVARVVGLRRFATETQQQQGQKKGSVVPRVLGITFVGLGVYCAYEATQIMKLDQLIKEGKDSHEQLPHNWQVGFIPLIFCLAF